MPADQGEDAERFAAAVEQGWSPDPIGEAELARDLEIVAMLGSRRTEFDPHPDARARARARLVATLAAEPPLRAGPVPAESAPERTAPLGRPVAAAATAVDAAMTVEMARVEPAEAEQPATGDTPVPASVRPGRASHGRRPSRAAARADAATGPARRGSRRRVVLIGAAAMVVLIALTGGGVLASRDALPGDALYGVKRAAESVGLAFVLDDTAEARRHLELATTRLDEAERLSRTPDADPQVLRSTIQDFDASTGEGSRRLLTGEDAGGAAALADLRTWAGDQAERLTVMRGLLPTPAAPAAEGSLKMLDRLVGRAEALQGRTSCDAVTSGTVDDLGPLPAVGACVPRPAGGGAPQGGDTGGDVGGSRSGSGTDPGPTGRPADPDPGPRPGAGDQGRPDQAPRPGVGGAPDAGSPGTDTGPSPSTEPEPQDEGADRNLLPDVTVPPLLPGLPGISVG